MNTTSEQRTAAERSHQAYCLASDLIAVLTEGGEIDPAAWSWLSEKQWTVLAKAMQRPTEPASVPVPMEQPVPVAWTTTEGGCTATHLGHKLAVVKQAATQYSHGLFDGWVDEVCVVRNSPFAMCKAKAVQRAAELGTRKPVRQTQPVQVQTARCSPVGDVSGMTRATLEGLCQKQGIRYPLGASRAKLASLLTE